MAGHHDGRSSVREPDRIDLELGSSGYLGRHNEPSASPSDDSGMLPSSRHARETTLDEITVNSGAASAKYEGGLATPDKASASLSRSNSPSPRSIKQQQFIASQREITDWEHRFISRLSQSSSVFLAKNRRTAKVLQYLSGPSPPIVETSLKPFLPRVEAFITRLFHPIHRARHVVLPTFLIAWLLGFIFLVRSSYYHSSTSAGTPQWIGTTDSFWAKDAGCGLNGTYCQPFDNSTLLFRCPAQSLDVKLLNDRAVGSQEVIYKPLVVGGGDSLGTYRGDSWICQSAIHAGLYGDRQGGCGKLTMVGEFINYIGVKRNGVDSVGFASDFPSSYRFEPVAQGECKDLRDDILGFNVAMSVIFSFVIRPPAFVFFWVLFCMGFWHVVLISDPSASPPDYATGFQYFLPAIFIAMAFWRHSWRWVVPAFEPMVLERTILYLAGFWLGVLVNVSFSWLPISRLTPHDIQQQPGGLVAVICLAIVLALCVLNQLRVIRRTGWFWFYLKWYAVGGVVIGILCALPNLEFRFHHYFAGMVLTPGCAFVTRPSAAFQGFLLGMFLDGAGRWGFDSILQTPASLVGDGSTGSPLPTFLTTAANFTANQASIYWGAIPESISSSYNGFGLIVDDVLAYSGSATNFTISSLDASIPHYFRLAYQSSGSFGDFTKAATAYIANGTWLAAASGAG
ncbi:hypothetical protein T439DRAFT_297341 [Meredithblackwellia eburnea MCA 4105]